MSYIGFIKESFTNMKTVGTVTRSSKYLSRQMVKVAAYGQNDIVVELGAGDGAITQHILKNLGPNGKLISFELNDVFIEDLKKIKDPRLTVVQRDAAHIEEVLSELGHENVRHVISALPLVAFSDDTKEEIIGACVKALGPGGKFIQLHYSPVLKRLYNETFSDVDVTFVIRNFPPAWVFACAV